MRNVYMNYASRLLLLVFVISNGQVLAEDANISFDNLKGKWVKGGKENCNSSASEYVLLRGNGVVELGRGNSPRTVGFWELSKNVITLHMLIAPSEADNSNVFYKGRYSYSYLTAEVLEASEGAIEIVTGTTGDIQRQTLARCN
jgi:hypothetical protein